ncbi:hypothetical protein AA15973_3007 [Komagataeibacter sucrofermentans DSM 15973]|nr:hypothetical protein AA15973_3007 [Komagataeibacter sucrofermentans DSM 15973]
MGSIPSRQSAPIRSDNVLSKELDLKSDDFAQLAVTQGHGIAIDTHKFGGTSCGRTHNEVFQKPFLDAYR